LISSYETKDKGRIYLRRAFMLRPNSLKYLGLALFSLLNFNTILFAKRIYVRIKKLLESITGNRYNYLRSP